MNLNFFLTFILVMIGISTMGGIVYITLRTSNFNLWIDLLLILFSLICMSILVSVGVTYLNKHTN